MFLKKKIHHLLNRATSTDEQQCDTCVLASTQTGDKKTNIIQKQKTEANKKKQFFAGPSDTDRDTDRMTDRKKQKQEVYLDQLKQLVPGVNNHTASKVNNNTLAKF